MTESSFILDARQALRESDALIRAGKNHPSPTEQNLKARLAELIVHAAWLERQVAAPGPVRDDSERHRKIRVEGEIEVCAGCVNSLGYNVAWEQAHPVGAVRVELTQEQVKWTLEVLRVIRHEHEWPAVEKALRKALETPRG